MIRAPKVRLIDENGDQLGIVSLDAALLKAEDSGLDLVQVSADIAEPVCKILDYGKYRYEQEKKLQKSKKAQKNTDVKGIRLSVKIGQHDFETKLKRANEFLEKGHKLSLQLRFKGREMAHTGLGADVLKRFVESIPGAVIEQEPKMMGRGMTMVVARGKVAPKEKQEIKENKE
jgi:translation initiation factor IF-3